MATHATMCATDSQTRRGGGRSTAAARAAAVARLLKAMAHPVRVRLLRELAMAERCVGDLSVATRTTLPTVSRHLAQLHAAGILRARKHGTHVFYAWRTPCVGNILTCLDNLLRRTTRSARARGRPASAQRSRP